MFEIAKTAHGYASTPSTLVSFNGANGAYPEASLIADAHGDLFGTTEGGGVNNEYMYSARCSRSPAAASVPVRRLAIR